MIEKAIEYLKWRFEVHGGKIGLYDDDGSTKAYELAISALEKQISKKVRHISGMHSTGRCPVCSAYTVLNNYCPNCGQRLEWD